MKKPKKRNRVLERTRSLRSVSRTVKRSLFAFNKKKEMPSHGSVLLALGLGRVSALLLIPLLLLAVGLSITPLSSDAAPGINEQINFQARLLNDDGSLVADGDYHLRFRIYSGGDGDLGGGDETLEWTETHSTGNLVTVANGYLYVQLGSITAFGSSVDWNEDTLWLSMEVGGTSGPTWDGEMDPFLRFTSVPYAFNADQLDGLDSGDFAQLGPAAVQTLNSSNTAIRINQTGSGDLLQLQDGGTDILTLDQTGLLEVGNNTTSGDITLYDGSDDSATVSVAALTTDRNYTLPNESGTFCLTSGNCAGVGGTGDVLQNGNSFAASMVIGTNDSNTLSLETGGTTRLTIGTDGTIDLANYDCSGNANGGVLTVDASNNLVCDDDDGGGSAPTLQIAYDNGASITTTDNRDLLVTLANTTTDSDFVVDIASGSTSVVEFRNNGTADLRIDTNGIDLIDVDTADFSGATVTFDTGEIEGADIADNTIEEVDLELTNAPTDNYILSFDSGTGGFTWIPDDTGGAGDVLQNGNSFGAAMVIGTNDSNTLALETAGTSRLTIATDGSIDLANYDCSGNANGGVLTVDGSGNLICDDDDGGGAAPTLQSAYNNGNTISSTDARDLSFTLTDTATDSDFVVNIANGSTSEFVLQYNATADFRQDSNGVDLLDVDVADFSGATVTFDAGEIVNADISSLASTKLTDGGTISFDWVDAEVDDALTISATGSVADGALSANVSLLGASIQDGEVDDDLTISGSGSVADGALSANVSLLGASIAGNEITDNTIEEVDLEVTNGPTDNYILSYDSGTGGFTWIDPASAGVDTFADIEIDNVSQSDAAAILDFKSSDFSVNEPIANSFDITIQAERVEDLVGGMVTGNTETGVTVTYIDGDGTLDFVVDNLQDLAGTLDIASGGTGATSAQGAIDAISGLTTTGDLLYYDGANSTRLPRGSNGQCLTTAGGTLSWDDCDTGSGSGGAITLQDAYDNGNTLTSSNNRDIDITLANTATDSDFTIDIATGSTSVIEFQNNGTADFRVDSSGVDLIDVDVADFSGANVTFDSDEITDAEIVNGLTISSAGSVDSTALTDGGTISFDWVDAEIADNLTVNASGSVADGALSANVSLLGASIQDGEVDDDLTISGSGSVADGALSANVSLLGASIQDGEVDDDLTISGSGSVADGALSANVSLLGSSIAGNEITDDTIEEVDLEVTNAPTDNYVLTYDSGTGGFTWVDPSGIGNSPFTDGGSFVYPTNTEDLVLGGSTTGTADIWLQSSGAAIFNEQGADVDFRVESDTITDAFFVEGSDGSIDLGAYDCSGNANGGVLTVDSSGNLICDDDDGGGAAPTLQTSYDNGNIITSSNNRDIDISLADTATDSNLDIDIAADNTVSISRLNNAVTESPTQLLLLENLDTNLSVSNGIVITDAGGGLTDAIDVSDTDITNAINIGQNTFLGTTAIIDFTNFDVNANGQISIVAQGASPEIVTTGDNAFEIWSQDSSVIRIDSDNDGLENFSVQNSSQTLLNLSETALLTIGNGSNASSLSLSDGSSNNGTFSTAALSTNRTYTLPNEDGTVCLTSGNCAGVGGTGDVLQNGNSFGGAMIIGTNDSNTLSLETGGTTRLTIATNGTIDLANYDCSGNANGGVLTVDASNNLICDDDDGGGAAPTLQSAYDNGNTLTSSNNRDIDITLANTATDSDFTIDIATGSTSVIEFQNNGTADFRVDSSGVDLIDVDVADFSGANVTFDSNEIVDSEVSDTITVGASGSVNDSALSANVSLLGSSIQDGEVDDDLTISGSGSVADGALSAYVSLLGSSIAGNEITDNTIEEVDLEATNGPTDNYILSYDSGTGGFTWVQDDTGAGSTTLQNAYNNGNTLTTTNNRDLLITLDDTATDSDYIVNIANGSTSVFELQYNSTADLRADSNGIDLLDVDTADFSGATVTFDSNEIVSGEINSLQSTKLTDGGTIGFAWVDAEVANAITISSSGSVDSTALNDGGTIAFDWVDAEIADNLTINASGTVNWSALSSYPAACGAGSAITALGDSPTCTAFNTDTSITLDDAYETGNALTTSNNRDITFTLANTATDSDFIVNVASGSSSQFLLQNNGVTDLRQDSNGLDLLDVDVADFTGATVTFDANEITSGEINSLASTKLTDGGTISFDWVDAEVADNLTISSAGSVDDGALSANVSLLGSSIASNEITDNTIQEVDFETTNTATDNYILSFDQGTGGFTWVQDNTGAGTITLQNAYDNGNTITTNDASDVLITLANTTTDSDFIVNIASGGAGMTEFQNNGVADLRVDTSGVDLLDVDVADFSGATVTFDSNEITSGEINSLTSTKLTDGGTIAFDWVDAEIADTLTLGSSSSVNSLALTDGGTIAFDWVDAEVADNLTINASGSVNWSALTSYPSACGAGTAITALGDSPTCTAFNTDTSITLDDAYETGNTLTTSNNRNINFTLANTATDSDLIVNIASGSTSQTEFQNNGTADLRIDTSGVDLIDVDVADFSGATVTFDSNEIVSSEINSLASTKLTDGGTIAFDWVDAEVADALTINSSGNVTWSALSSYPAACGAGTAITALGDSPTCTAFATSDTTYSAGDDLDLSGTTFNIEPTLNFVSTVTQDSGALTLQTTTSGNIELITAGNIDANGENIIDVNDIRADVFEIQGDTNTYIDQTGGGDTLSFYAGGVEFIQLTEAGTDTIDLLLGVDVSGDVLPTTDDTYDLGSSTLRWQDLYLGPASLHVGVDGDDGTLSYDTTANSFEFNRQVTPSVNNTYDIGSSANAWNDIFADGSLILNGTNFTESDLDALDDGVIADSEVNNNITVDWTGLQNYPSACGGGQAVTAVGDTLTCSTFATDTSVTLQDAYANGNSISTSNNRNINFTLANTSTDSDFIVNIASGSTSMTEFQNNGTADLRVDTSGVDLLDVDVADFSGANVTFDSNEITSGEINSLQSTKLTDGGTISFDWVDAEVANNLTVDWTGLQNYPSACGAGLAVTAVGDTLTCQAILSYSAGDDIDISGTDIDIEPTLNFVQTITRASSNLTLQTTTSGNVVINAAGSTVINESGADSDFRVEGVSQPNAFFFQGSDGFVGIRTNDPDTPLHVDGPLLVTAGHALQFNAYWDFNGDSNNHYESAGSAFDIWHSSGTNELIFRTATSGAADAIISFTEALAIDQSGRVTVNDNGADLDFRVEGDTESNLLFIDAGSNEVGIGTNSPSARLDVTAPGLAFQIENRADNGSNTVGYFTGNNRTTGADGDEGILDFYLDDDTGASQRFGRFIFEANDVTSTSKDGEFRFDLQANNTNTQILALSGNNGLIFNETGIDVDFRIESDTLTHALFVRGSDGYVGIGGVGASNPIRELHVNGELVLNSDDATYNVWIQGGTTTTGGDTRNLALLGHATNDDLILNYNTEYDCVAVGGTSCNQALDVTGRVEVTDEFYGPSGALNDPSFTFSGDADLGLYRHSANHLGVTTGNVLSGLFDGNGLQVADGAAGTPSLAFHQDGNTGFYRYGADQIGIALGGTKRFHFSYGGNGSRIYGNETNDYFEIDGTNEWHQFFINDTEILRLRALSPFFYTGLEVIRSGSSPLVVDRTTNDGPVVTIQGQGTTEGSINVSGTTVSYNGFTGSHLAYNLTEQFTEGHLVAFNGVNRSFQNRPGAEVLYGIYTTQEENDPRVLGSFLSIVDESLGFSEHNPYQVMAVGNGHMWVVDEGEDIAPGDYLISSDTKGHARLDPRTDEISYVVARAAQKVDWADVTTMINGKKHKLVSVTFEIFARDNINSTLVTENVEVQNNISIGGDLQVDNDLTLNGELVTGELFVEGKATIVELVVETVATIEKLIVLGDTEVQDIYVNGHIISSGDTPEIAVGADSGTDAKVEIIGNDIAGTITITLDGDAVAGELATIDFVEAYGSAPSITLTPINSQASQMDYFVNRDIDGFSIKASGNVLGDTIIKFDYQVIE